MPFAFPKVIAHRGAPKAAPENTHAAFAEAARVGATWVELDVQLSRDLVPFVFHDDLLDRTSNGKGPMIEADAALLDGLDAGSWFSPDFAGEKLPRFSAVIDQLVRLRLGVNIEIKSGDERAAITAERGLAVAMAGWPADRQPPLVTSFSRVAIETAKRVAPDWPRGLVADIWPADWREYCAAMGCISLHVAVSQVTPERVAEARAAGIAVLAYVVDDPERAHHLWNLGVASLFSDRPERLLD